MSSYSKEMHRITDMLTGIVHAINSVIHVDVTIIDSNFNRLAATGQYLGDVGCKVDARSIFAYAIQKGQAFIIENPREHEACADCSQKYDCKEFAEVCSPICLGNDIIGVIGLIAFDKVSAENMLANRESLLEFLYRMSELIASKVLEVRQQETLKMQSRELEIILNAMESAVFSLDKQLRVCQLNTKARELLYLKTDEVPIHLIESLSSSEKAALFKTQAMTQGQFVINRGSQSVRLLYQSQPVIVDNEVHEVVFTCTNIQSLLHTFNDVVGYGQSIGFGDIIGKNEQLLSTIDFARRAASSVSTVLIHGESGTGKELFARAMHYESKRAEHPFIAVNCAAIPDNLLESELFGYEEGAFTGALKGGKIGKFEMAQNGTIFLDEIGDMPLHLQAKLLRVLQENMVYRLGAAAPTRINVRIVAATNKNLSQLVEEGAFREDLFYRLNVIPILVPPLRKRQDDLTLLVEAFVKLSAQKLEKTVVRATSGVMNCFRAYTWPGNVRELQNTIEFAVNMNTTGVIDIEDLPERFRQKHHEDVQAPSKGNIVPLKLLEKKAIEEALAYYGHDKEGIEASVEALGISRATIYRKIKAYGIALES